MKWKEGWEDARWSGLTCGTQRILVRINLSDVRTSEIGLLRAYAERTLVRRDGND